MSLRGVFGGLHERPAPGAKFAASAAAAAAVGKRGPTAEALKAAPAKKKRKKDKPADWQWPFAANHALPAPVRVNAAAIQVRNLLSQGCIAAARDAFLREAPGTHPALADLLPPLLRGADLEGALQAVRAAKSAAPLPQPALLASLLALPQGATLEDGKNLAQTLVAAAQWRSAEHEDYFRRMSRPLVLEFLDEALQAIQRLSPSSQRTGGLQRQGTTLMNVAVSKGEWPGDLVCSGQGPGLAQAGSEEDGPRGLLPSDAVALSLVSAQAAPASGAFCECEVVRIRPFVVKALDAKHPVVLSALQGVPCRVDKLANRTGFGRMLCALHCLSEPPRQAGEDKGPNKVPRRLHQAHRPAEGLREALLAGGGAFASNAPAGVLAAQAPPSGSKKSATAAKEPRAEELQTLNSSQQQALLAAATRTLSLVQGPPGTGKTKSCIRVLGHWARTWTKDKAKSCLLATSDSNIAVDNLVEGLAAEGLQVVRLGRPEAARPEVLQHCADTVAAKSLGVASLRDVDRDTAKRAVQTAIQNAQVICCTAIGAGAGLLNDFSFPMVLMDEASQATEPATLVPVCRGCRQLVLVGDHCQLPPTVASAAAALCGLGRSLFERLAQIGIRPTMLEVQYRMHPGLSSFPAQRFYAGRLTDGVQAEARQALPGFPWPVTGMPLCALGVSGAERHEGTSFVNDAEAREVVRIVQGFISAGVAPQSLGVVTPYGSQVKLIRRYLQGAGVKTGRECGGLEVNSVDGFQGREKDAVIMSTVRASPQGGVGFVADWRRANVAFTRARKGLVVVCHPTTLARDVSTWRPWLHWVQQRGLVGGAWPWLPPEDPGASPVGIAALELGVAGHGTRARSRSRSRSPLPPWKLPPEAQCPGRQAAPAAAAASFARQTAPDLLPMAGSGGLQQAIRLRAPVEVDDGNDDDRSDAVRHGPGERDVGVGKVNYSLTGMGGSQSSSKVSLPGAKKTNPSPFVGGSRVDVAKELSSLGVLVRKLPTPPSKAPAPGLLSSYASSGSEEEYDEEGTYFAPDSLDACGKPIVATESHAQGETEGDEESSSESGSDGEGTPADLLAEFM